MTAPRLRFCWFFGLFALTSVAFTGCAGLQTGPEGELPAWLVGQKAPEAAPPDGPTYTVEIRGASSKPKTAKLPHREGMHLQDAMTQSGAAKKFDRMDLYILRTPPQGGPKQRLSAVYDVAERRVAWESDYAIHPGDHIVVTEDTTSKFDEMMSRFLPFGR